MDAWSGLGPKAQISESVDVSQVVAVSGRGVSLAKRTAVLAMLRRFLMADFGSSLYHLNSGAWNFGLGVDYSTFYADTLDLIQ